MAFRSLSAHVFLSQVISVLPLGNGRSSFSSPCEISFAVPGTRDQSLREIDALGFFFFCSYMSCNYWCTVTLTNSHPAMGLLLQCCAEKQRLLSALKSRDLSKWD